MATLKTRIATFAKGAAANGNSGFHIVLDTLDHWREHNDPVHFLRLLELAAPSDQRVFRMIAAAIVSGANAKMTGPAKDAQLQFDAKAMADLRALANDGASFRSYQKVKAKGERKEKTVDDLAQSFVKAAIRKGASEQEALAAVRKAFVAASEVSH